MRAILLLSGGLDSSTLLAYMIDHGMPPGEILGLTILYGQKHQKEVTSANKIADFYGVRTLALPIPPSIFKGSGSTLIDPNLPNPHLTYQEIEESFGVSPTYVPFRNGTLLSLATIIALTQGASEVYAAMHAEDARNWAYPDCTPEFIGAMANSIYIGTYHKVRLFTPFQWSMKRDIVHLGIELGVPYEYTWSCYEGEEKACGLCPTCVERLEAFKVNGATDPLPYGDYQLRMPL